ncbi:hypothetical protein [Ulvibacterium sp.]|uniref:hypothetical protein n=1 Tax=Ulvibacterium sp. TaxID=2665914 RepID=UPI0026398D61|nr:hypothetical protein [Ulvibacterium sp.]
MDIFHKIDEIFDIIQDPRNVDPDDFAEFYPNEGQLGNNKNLTKKEISALFQTRNIFKKPSNWSGYKPLYSKYHLLVALCKKMTSEDLDTVCGYFASRCIKNNSTFIMDFWEIDGILPKKEIGELIGMYTVFFKNILGELSLDMENAIPHKVYSGSDKITIQKSLSSKPTAALTLVKLIAEGNLKFSKIPATRKPGKKDIEYNYFGKKYYEGQEVSDQIGEDYNLDEKTIANFRQYVTDTGTWFMSTVRREYGGKNLFGPAIANLIKNLNYLIETDDSLKPAKSFLELLEELAMHDHCESPIKKESLLTILNHLNQK